jgi:hypothetical protein
MTAVLNQPAKLLLAQKLLQEDSDQNYYVAIGRSNDWDSSDTAPTPISTEREERNLRLSMQSMKSVLASSLTVPRNAWSSGTIYSRYNDNQEGNEPTQPYYVMTDENQVYVCIQQGRTNAGVAKTSTVKPTGTATEPFLTADGYIWKFLYSVGTLDATNFLAANFQPIKYVEDSAGATGLTAAEVEQVGIQNAADSAHELVGGLIVSGGSGYVSTPAVTIVGDGSGAKLQATINGGQVSKLELIDSSGTITMGKGYNYAEIQIAAPASGTQATARAILGPKSSTGFGFGSDPRVDLRTRAIMYNSRPDGDESGKFLINQDFRQIGLVKNPYTPDSASSGNLLTDPTANALYRIQFSSVATPFTIDNTIEGGTSGAKAYVDKVDSDLLYYHQDETTGFTQFDSAETVTETTGSGSGVIQHPKLAPDVDPFSGDILYIDNRAAITRSSGQEDDLKIIIQI